MPGDAAPRPPPRPQLPLRQRKLARTKLAILDEMIRRLDSRPLADVLVKDLCAAVEISEGTFFNYFPQKTDVLVYFIQLWSLEMAWHGRELARRVGGLSAIEEVFARTATQLVEHPNVMAEIIAFQARMDHPPAIDAIGLAERLTRFPTLAGIETVEARGFHDVVAPLLDQAVRAGALPSRVDRRAAMTALGAIFFGVPVALRVHDPRAIAPAYRRQLRLLWRGLRSNDGGSP